MGKSECAWMEVHVYRGVWVGKNGCESMGVLARLYVKVWVCLLGCFLMFVRMNECECVRVL